MNLISEKKFDHSGGPGFEKHNPFICKFFLENESTKGPPTFCENSMSGKSLVLS